MKRNTIFALLWNGIDKVGFQVIALLVGIFTARLLTPKDFGLMGALSVFTMLSNILIESGFTSALVRRPHNTREEYTAILYFNLSISLFLYAILFFSAPFISSFFNMPELTNLSRFLFLTIIVNSLGIVQTIVLTKELSFRLLSVANLIAAIVAGAVTLVLIIFFSFDYWALAWQVFLQSAVKVLILWIFGSYKLTFKAHFGVVKEVFSFSCFLLLTSLFNAIVKNIYNILIGRLFSVQQLGYYSQANKFQQIPSNVVATTMTGVAFPVLSKLRENTDRQVQYFSKILRLTACVIFPLMLGMFAVTDSLVSLVLTDKWLPAVPMFRLLILAAILYPLHSLNLNFILVRGYSKINFYLDLTKNVLILTSIAFSFTNITLMLLYFSLASLFSYIIDIFVVQRITGYSVWKQIKNILPFAVASIVMLLMIFGVAECFSSELTQLQLLCFQVFVAMIFYACFVLLINYCASTEQKLF
ncbi:MAG: lipopolysaccharide biosynthesis protein [Paludibacteraceae bacterium]|nr:lipopolysaccharide biosynthesis protein [Paludibacteraceae bacterium]